MPKFIGIDLLDSLEKIMKKNMQSYQSDFSLCRRSDRPGRREGDWEPVPA